MKKFWNKYKEIITYIIFGVLTTLVSWGTYNVFVGAVKMPVWLGNALSWICAVTFAYVTNKLWVFESKSWNIKLVVKEIISFFGSRALTGVLFEILGPTLLAKVGFDNLFYPLFEKMHLNWGFLYTEGFCSKVVLSVIVVIVNYFFGKFLVFSKKKEKGKPQPESANAESEGSAELHIIKSPQCFCTAAFLRAVLFLP